MTPLRLLRLSRRFTTTPPHLGRPIPPLTSTLPSRTLPLKLHPPPSCTCAPAVDPPVDTHSPLANSAPRYAHHILLPTGRTNWASRVELDPAVPAVAAVKAELRGGAAPVLVTAASEDGGAYVFTPGSGGRWFERSENVDPVQNAAQNEGEWTGLLQREGELVRETVVVVCTHGARDNRCGVVGAAVYEEFRRVLGARGVLGRGEGRVNVLASSHLSGHKWAGNVVVYRPEGWAVWYGRVVVEGVERIVRDTVVGGGVVAGIVRGVLGAEVEGAGEGAE